MTISRCAMWVCIAFGLVIIAAAALAHDGRHPEFDAWYGNAKVTEEARERLTKQGFAWTSCCNQADRVKAEFRTVKDPSDPLGYRDEWYYLKKGDEVRADEWVRIPDDVIHHEDDPTMPPQLKVEGVLFVYNGMITCFWAPQDGG